MALATVALVVILLAVRRDDFTAGMALSLGLVVTAGVGAAVAARRPDHPCGWLLAAITVFAAASAAGTDYVQTSLARAHRFPLTEAVGWVTTWAAMPTVALGALLLLTFPTGQLPSPRWRGAVAVALAAVTAQAIAVALMPGPLPIAATISNPVGVDGASAVLGAVSGVAGFATAAVLFSAVARLVLRYRRARGVERDQLRTVARALPVTVAGLAAAMVAEGTLNEASFYFAVVGLTAVPVAIGWAILRHGLFDIEVLVNRALVYGSLTVVVAGLYVAVVAGLGRALRQSAELGASVIATAAVAVAFGPLRFRLQTGVDRLMYGDRPDPYAALSGLGRRLEDAAAPDQALPMAAETVGRSLKLGAIEIKALADGALEPAAVWGDPGPASGGVRFDLIHGREFVGQLVVWPRAGETLSVKDRTLLADVCSPIAVAAHAAAVGHELKKSRQSLVSTREEDRRRLRADLHDGLGPELAGVMLGLGAVRNAMRLDPDAADEQLAQLQQQVRGTVTQVRTLVDGLAPAVDQLGLAGAIRQGAARLTAGTAVHVDIDGDLPALPAAVEVAAYRITMEALTNIARHAGATRCCVQVRIEDGLHVEVVDNGRGLPSTVVPGVGLSSMRQRAAELGGTCEITSAAAGGTQLVARLPLP